MEVEIELDGSEVTVECPVCKGEGEVRFVDAFIKCWVCKGEGEIETAAYGTITSEIDTPPRNEGYL